MSAPRTKEISIVYNGVETWNDISPYLTSFRYTDTADASDTISIDLSDRDLKWSSSWMPKKEDRICPYIALKNWEYEGDSRTFVCGDFIVDDFSFSAPPVSCSINGVSSPVQTDFKETENSKTWEAAAVGIIAQELAGKYQLKLVYDVATDVAVAKIEQDKQTDSDFLNRLCNKYGLGMKIYANRLVIWSYREYFARDAVHIITQDQVSRWSYRSSMQGTYTGARVTYTNPKSKEGIDVMVGKEGRLCKINEKADNEQDARMIGENAIRNANRKENTMQITMPVKLGLFATNNVWIKGFGKMDGKYFVESVSHDIKKTSYQMQLSVSRIPEEEL